MSLETGVCRSSARGGGNLSGPVIAKFVARTRDGGEGRLQWKTKAQENFPKSGQTVAYTLPAGKAWQEITVTLPIQGKAGVIRLYRFPIARHKNHLLPNIDKSEQRGVIAAEINLPGTNPPLMLYATQMVYHTGNDMTTRHAC